MAKFLDDEPTTSTVTNGVDSNGGNDNVVGGTTGASVDVDGQGAPLGDSSPEAESIVSRAQAVVETVEQALDKIANERHLKELWGAVDPTLSVFGYVGYMVAQFGVDETAEKLGIPVELLKEISVWVSYIGEAHKLVSEIPTPVSIAFISWAAKRLGKAEFTRQVVAQGGQSFTKSPASWGHVGAALAGLGAPHWLAEAVATKGPVLMLALAAFFWRHQIYGAGKAWYDANKPRIEDIKKEIDEDIYDAGDPSEKKRLWINPETGEVRVGNNPGKPFIRMNEGGEVKHPSSKDFVSKAKDDQKVNPLIGVASALAPYAGLIVSIPMNKGGYVYKRYGGLIKM